MRRERRGVFNSLRRDRPETRLAGTPDYWVIKPSNRTSWASPRLRVYPQWVPRYAFYATSPSGDDRLRTCDNRLAEPVLYQLSYIPVRGARGCRTRYLCFAKAALCRDELEPQEI